MIVRLADRLVQVEGISDWAKRFLSKYEVSDTEHPEIEIKITRKDIEEEEEVLRVQRRITEELLPFDTLLMHGSTFSIDGEGIMITAPSGTGKSTHAALWRKQYGDRVVMINDDKPFLQVTDAGVVAFGTPWAGKHRLENNISAPLKSICFLEQAKENRIEKMDAMDAYLMAMSQIYRPKEKEKVEKTLALIEKLVEKVAFYRIYCNMDPAAAEMVYRIVYEK